jgi:outer membrane protein assembly factor BamC
MSIKQRHQTTLVLCAALASALASTGCSSVSDALSGDKVDYRSSGKQSVKLDVPPDLSQLPGQVRYGQVATSSVSASSLMRQPEKASETASTKIASSAAGDVRLERQGQTRWLAVNQTPEQVWEQVHAFWIDSGFELSTDKPELGLMETAWSENRTKVPRDGILRNTFGRVFDALYDTGERDQYRTRIERTATGSEIYVTHHGLSEEYEDNAKKERTVWRGRPNDPGLEAEMLSRLMLKLGASKEAAVAVQNDKPATPAPATTLPTIARLGSDGSSLTLDADYDTAWRRVGLALDRSGFTVENRDRKQGSYEVRLSDGDPDATKPGFFARMFGATNPNPDGLSRFTVQIKGQGKNSLVNVLNDKGQAATSPTGKRIAKQLLDELN